jgi:hypothetical protein
MPLTNPGGDIMKRIADLRVETQRIQTENNCCWMIIVGIIIVAVFLVVLL